MSQTFQKQIVEKHISQIKPGDTIITRIDGEERTVCKNNIKFSELFGITIFGDSFNLGNVPVQVVIYPNVHTP